VPEQGRDVATTRQDPGAETSDRSGRLAAALVAFVCEAGRDVIAGLLMYLWQHALVGVAGKGWRWCGHHTREAAGEELEYVESQLGPAVIERFKGRVSSNGRNDRTVWAALATVADANPDLEKDLHAKVEQAPSLLDEEPILAWYARTLPLPTNSSAQVKQRVGTRGGCRRADRGGVCRDG
jgi:hypothetical protein